MDYGKALKIGLARAENAIETIRRWAGMKACTMCTVKPAPGVTPRSTRGWGPICEQSWKEIACDDGIGGRGHCHLLMVDEDSQVKACTLERYQLGEVLRLADGLPMRVAMPGVESCGSSLTKKIGVYRERVDYFFYPQLKTGDDSAK